MASTASTASTAVRLTARERAALQALIGLHSTLLARLGRYMQRDSDLSGADYEVLVNLEKAPGGRLRAFELAATMGWEKSRLSHHLSRMAARGHVEREPCATDNRGAVVVLTAAGRAAFEAAEPVHLAHVRRLFLDALTPEQLDTFAELSGLVLANVGREEDAAGAMP